jgi:hypothetical protein
MTPTELQELVDELHSAPACSVEQACRAIGCGRTLGYELARTTGQLAEGLRVLRVGRCLKVPTRPLLELLGYRETDQSPV